MPVYKKLVDRLTRMGRLEWVRGEVMGWEDPKTFALPDPQKRFMKIKNLRSLKPRNLTVLQKIAAWREGEAVKRDCLAKAIVRDETLLEIARKIPRDIKTLSGIRGMYQKEMSKGGVAILKAIENAMEVAEGNLIELPESNGHATTRGVEELLAAYVQIRSEELKIEPSVLADRKKIHSFVTHFEQNQDVEEHILFQGWRKELIGIPMFSLLSGKMGLKIDPSGQVCLINS
jgi:ribonuclease D